MQSGERLGSLFYYIVKINDLDILIQRVGVGVSRAAVILLQKSDADLTFVDQAAIAVVHTVARVSVADAFDSRCRSHNVIVDTLAGVAPAPSLIGAGDYKLELKVRKFAHKLKHAECRHGVKAERTADAEAICSAAYIFAQEFFERGGNSDRQSFVYISVSREAHGGNFSSVSHFKAPLSV